jgi:5-methyltetrahydrofolate--homocysteine methyltransferase
VDGGERPSLQDYLGGFAVSIHGADEVAEDFKRQQDDYSAIMTKALAGSAS